MHGKDTRMQRYIWQLAEYNQTSKDAKNPKLNNDQTMKSSDVRMEKSYTPLKNSA